MPETATPELDSARDEIDSIDQQLLELIGRRIGTCRRIAEYKVRDGVDMMQPDRLDRVRERATTFAAEHGISAAFLRTVFDTITEEACRVENEIMGEPDRSTLGRSACRIDHVAIAVRDLETAISTFRDGFGFELLERRRVSGEISGMDSATMRAGGVTFVLCQGDSPESNVARYVEHYGPGVQHIAVEVEDQQGVLDDLTDRGCDLLTGIIHAPGLDQSFTKRDPNSGIQVEFVTRADNDGFHDDNVRELFTAMEREGVY